MTTRKMLTCALVLAALRIGSAAAQETPSAPGVVEPERAQTTAEQAGMPPQVEPPGHLSQWITYSRPDCCGPIGGDGPILVEIYGRSGLSLPVAEKIFGHVLEAGFFIEGGGRSMFFNPAMDRAWVIDLSLCNIKNQGQHNDFLFNFGFLEGTPPAEVIHKVNVTALNRTNVNATIGREWWLRTPANCPAWRWRVGCDAGGAIGSVKCDFEDRGPNGGPLQGGFHRTDVLGAVLLSAHTDLEIPCGGCCTFMTGFRAEWTYNWMDVLQTRNDSDLQDLNLLFTLGVRF